MNLLSNSRISNFQINLQCVQRRYLGQIFESHKPDLLDLKLRTNSDFKYGVNSRMKFPNASGLIL